jgi:hypothetical protein
MENLAITIRTYTNDGWYGKRTRYCYLGPDGNGFKNKTEASKSKSIFKKYIKNLIKYELPRTEIDGDIEIGLLSNFTTYKYCGSGPSYSCPQFVIEHSALEKFSRA